MVYSRPLKIYKKNDYHYRIITQSILMSWTLLTEKKGMTRMFGMDGL